MDVLAACLSAAIRPRRPQRSDAELAVRAAATVTHLPGAAICLSWGAGPPVLVVHGWEGSGTQFGDFIAALLVTGRRVVAVDAPGHGDSPEREFTAAAYARALLCAQHQVGPLDGVISHSLGSLAVAGALRDGLRTKSLALIAPVPSCSELLRGMCVAHGLDDAQTREFLRTMEAMLDRPTGDLDLAAYRPGGLPVLAYHDHDDVRLPLASTRALIRAWPGARLIETRGLGHTQILHDPATVRGIVTHITRAAGDPARPEERSHPLT